MHGCSCWHLEAVASREIAKGTSSASYWLRNSERRDEVLANPPSPMERALRDCGTTTGECSCMVCPETFDYTGAQKWLVAHCRLRAAPDTQRYIRRNKPRAGPRSRRPVVAAIRALCRGLCRTQPALQRAYSRDVTVW
jgi:hypothetical protein